MMAPRTKPPSAAPARLPSPPITPPTNATSSGPWPIVRVDGARAEDVEEGDDPGQQAGDRERRRDHPVRPDADELRHPEVLGRGAQLHAERRPLEQQRHPEQAATIVTTIVTIASREIRTPPMSNCIGEPRVRLDALLGAAARRSSRRAAGARS